MKTVFEVAAILGVVAVGTVLACLAVLLVCEALTRAAKRAREKVSR